MKAMKNLMLASLLIGLGACSNYEQDVLDASKYITVDAGFGTDSRVATNGLASVFQVDDALVSMCGPVAPPCLMQQLAMWPTM